MDKHGLIHPASIIDHCGLDSGVYTSFDPSTTIELGVTRKV
jgi:hypothetical protein